MSEFDRDLNPLLRRISNSRDGMQNFHDICELNDIDPSEGPDALASEIRLNGGNTFVNILRGWEGVSYKEIVEDVADKLDIRISDKSSVEKIEEEILEEIIKKYWDQLSEEEQEKLIEQIKKIDPNIKSDMVRNALRVGGIGATIALRGVIGPLVRSLLAKAAGVAVGARLAGFLVPGLNVILAVWTVIDVGGPAYRKTVPTVVAIAISRIDDADD